MWVLHIAFALGHAWCKLLSDRQRLGKQQRSAVCMPWIFL